MKALKSLIKSEALRRFLCWLAAQYIRFVYFTCRWELVGGDYPAALWDQNEPFILAFWHGRILMMPYCWRRSVPIHMLISQHRDGQIIARTVAHFGIETIAGSTSRGGSAALRAMLKALKSGGCIGITPDGPRGPRMRASTGIVAVAKMSGAAILPATFAVRRWRLLRSWDRFAVALPFSRGTFAWGEPIRVPRDADETAQEAWRLTVEEAMNRLGAETDRRQGHEPVEPAPLPVPVSLPADVIEEGQS